MLSSHLNACRWEENDSSEVSSTAFCSITNANLLDGIEIGLYVIYFYTDRVVPDTKSLFDVNSNWINLFRWPETNKKIFCGFKIRLDPDTDIFKSKTEKERSLVFDRGNSLFNIILEI